MTSAGSAADAAIDDVVVVGCGVVGLPFAVALAASGRKVLGIDIDAQRVSALAAATTDQIDDGLPEALAAGLRSGRLRFAQRLAASESHRAYVIAVPTPVDAGAHFDRTALDAAVVASLRVARDGDLLIVRSTVPVGTLRAIAAAAADAGRSLAFASCPDRSIAGRSYAEQRTVPNIVGGLTAEASAAARALLAPLGPVHTVANPETAEALKLFANAWRDARFALANEFALFCECAGIDYDELRTAGGAAFPRFDAPRAGPVGGPCLTKDAHLLALSAQRVGAATAVLASARRVNAGLVAHLCDRILDDATRQGPGARVAVLGLAFKGMPAVVDRRGSIGVALIDALRAARPALAVRGWDPASDAPAVAREATDGATIVVLANDHPALAQAELLDGVAQGAIVHDLCGMLAAAHAAARGLRVRRFGDGRRETR